MKLKFNAGPDWGRQRKEAEVKSLITKKDGKPALTRKTAAKYGRQYVAIAKVSGGYIGFDTWDDYAIWRGQK